MNRNKEFVKNTLILLIGKFATQFTSFLLIPLFTHYLLTDDYGWVDLLQTYISLFVPVLTLRMDSALFRFLIDSRHDENGKSNIISNILFITMIGITITIIVCITVSFFIHIKYLKLTIINLLIMMLSNVFLQVLRGLGKNKEYSISSIITGVLYLAINSVMILYFHFGAESILIASAIANFLVVIYSVFVSKIYKYFKISKINKKQIKKLLAYSLPMIPNSLSWWIVNVSDRTLISIFLGTAFNGIYTVSCKFSNLLNNVFSIFSMSWQETASLHINDKDKDEFFSSIINKLFMLFSCISLLIMAVLPLLYNLLIGQEYINSYNYIPILLYANSWNVMIGLIGGIYIAMKKTKEIASTTIMSAVINLVVNFALIKFIGLYAACISTLLSYLVMSIYRYIDCRKYIKIRLNVISIIVFTIVFGGSMYLYILNNKYLNIANLVIVSIYSLIINRKTIFGLKDMLKRKKSNKNSSKKEIQETIIPNDINGFTYIDYYDSYNLDNINNYLDDLDRIKMKIRFDNSVIKDIDFSKCSYEISDVILSETKVYNFEFNNDYLLRKGYYPKQISNNYELMKYILDQDYNYLAYIDPDVMDKEILIDIINYAFTKVYYLKVKNNEIDFDITNKFKNSKMVKHSYFKECYSYIDKMNKKERKSKKKIKN